ncbi:hypothetical protein OIU78_029392 [Salix suchowensis]|nr:hypothetical protein OIU78_029392 [Salix suchowensis]
MLAFALTSGYKWTNTEQWRHWLIWVALSFLYCLKCPVLEQLRCIYHEPCRLHHQLGSVKEVSVNFVRPVTNSRWHRF